MVDDRTPMPRMTVGQAGKKNPANLVPIFIAGVSVTGMVDSGASVCLVSIQFYQKLLKYGRNFKNSTNVKKVNKRLVCANKQTMSVVAEVNTSVKIGGLEWPATFWAVDQLVNDVIIGVDLLKSMEASIDLKNNMLTLFDGLAAVPMSTADELLMVTTTNDFEIPAHSEAVITVSCVQRPAENGN
jgi:predicted aspartyl protease